MQTINELTTYVSEKSRQYVEETGEVMDKFPTSIVDFVIEYVLNGCNFNSEFTENEIVSILEKGKNSIAMACVDIYAKVGAEGQTGHSENSISRTYKSEWISFSLLSRFPNYVNVF